MNTAPEAGDGSEGCFLHGFNAILKKSAKRFSSGLLFRLRGCMFIIHKNVYQSFSLLTSIMEFS